MEPVQYPYHIQVIYDLQADNTSAKFRVEIEGYDPRGGIMLLGRDFGLHLLCAPIRDRWRGRDYVHVAADR